MNAFENLKVAFDGPLAVITIHRPKALNALNQRTLEELLGALEQVVVPGIRVVAITGSGDKAFVAGADIRAMRNMNQAEAIAFSRLGHAVFNRIETLPIPVIAAVHGFALGGGCELALACDIIYATEDARFGQPEVGLGVIPGFGGTLRLARLVGVQAARELIYTGRRIKAREALQLGLISKIVEQAELMPACRSFAELLVLKGPRAIAASKAMILQGASRPLHEGAELEATAFAGLFGGAEQREGMEAFLERRKPEFADPDWSKQTDEGV